jgi:hypothetical protein
MLLLIALVGALGTGLSDVHSTAPSADQAGSARREPSAAGRSWDAIVLHHSATTGGSVASIDAVHRRQKDAQGQPWLGIGYHFVVGNGSAMGDGEVRPTFRWRRQLPGAHAGEHDYNEHGIGVCLIGNFNEQAPTTRQLAAVTSLIKSLSQQYAISRERIVRHADVHATLCPGRLFPMDGVLANLFPGDEGS